MDLKENNKYRYTDAAERNRKMNKFYIVASVAETGKSQHFTDRYLF